MKQGDGGLGQSAAECPAAKQLPGGDGSDAIEFDEQVSIGLEAFEAIAGQGQGLRGSKSVDQ
ncbi:hypothetical protein [Halomicronema sp. CCY15110]|uniref:hypothetical protein n=1 Tax=Halomicronema sp. CCY15110 TaxID=2767773 RepID=UPI002814E588|nr:hypothetical protein [Halomicronema sp. CCY15110]